MAPADNEHLWNALNEAIRSRARLYVVFYRAIERRLGQAAAFELCKEAIRNWGRGLAGDLRAHSPEAFHDLVRSFVLAPDGGRMFSPRVDRCDSQGLDVQFETCPLKSAWLEAGMAEPEVAFFCQMACEADYGTLEAAGFTVRITPWRPGNTGCCSLEIRRD